MNYDQIINKIYNIWLSNWKLSWIEGWTNCNNCNENNDILYAEFILKYKKYTNFIKQYKIITKEIEEKIDNLFLIDNSDKFFFDLQLISDVHILDHNYTKNKIDYIDKGILNKESLKCNSFNHLFAKDTLDNCIIDATSNNYTLDSFTKDTLDNCIIDATSNNYTLDLFTEDTLDNCIIDATSNNYTLDFKNLFYKQYFLYQDCDIINNLDLPEIKSFSYLWGVNEFNNNEALSVKQIVQFALVRSINESNLIKERVYFNDITISNINVFENVHLLSKKDKLYYEIKSKSNTLSDNSQIKCDVK